MLPNNTTFEKIVHLFIKEKVWPDWTAGEVYDYIARMAMWKHLILLKGKKKIIGAIVWYLNEIPKERDTFNQHNINIGRFVIADGLVVKPRYRNRPKLLLRLVRENLKAFRDKEAVGIRRLKSRNGKILRNSLLWHKIGGRNGRIKKG